MHPFKSLWIFLLYRFQVYFREDWKYKEKKEEESLKRERHETEAIVELLKKKKKK